MHCFFIYIVGERTNQVSGRKQELELIVQILDPQTLLQSLPMILIFWNCSLARI